MKLRPLDFPDREPGAAALSAGRVGSPSADGGSGAMVLSLNDPRLLEFMRDGMVSSSGMTVSVERALRNTTMFRAVSLISYAIGMLPLQLIHDDTKEKATDHPLYRVLRREPNGWQSAFDFRTLLQLRALVKGDGFARIIRSPDIRRGGRKRVIGLIPLETDHVTPKISPSWDVTYRYQPPKGAAVDLPASEIFHLRGLSLDGLRGLSLVRQARDAIGLALSAELAAARLYKNGVMAGGGLKMPQGQRLSDEAYARLLESLRDKEGAENAGKTLIFEEGLEYMAIALSARDAQMVDIRKLQVEEIARVSGVPRPLLMVDDTSWGSGVEALGRFFVQYALNPWFVAWQQAIERSLLDDADKEEFSARFNAAALLNGSTKDQADFFAKALGAGGQPAWMVPNEVRDKLDMPAIAGGDVLNLGLGAKPPEAPPADETEADPAKDRRPPAPRKGNDDEDED